MKVNNNVVYTQVQYPKDVEKVYDYAINYSLKGYSAYTQDGRYFKWNPQLNKAEVTQDEIVVLIPDTDGTTVAKTETVSTPSKSVQAIKEKINTLKKEIESLNTTVSSLSNQIAEKDKLVKEKENTIQSLQKQLEMEIAKSTQLQADIDEIMKL